MLEVCPVFPVYPDFLDFLVFLDFPDCPVYLDCMVYPDFLVYLGFPDCPVYLLLLLPSRSLIPSMSKASEKRRVWSRGLVWAVEMT